MSELEQYYNENYKPCIGTPFEELKESDKEAIRHTTHFAYWMIAYRMKEVREAVKDKFKNLTR